jgi:hypothetical protein
VTGKPGIRPALCSVSDHGFESHWVSFFTGVILALQVGNQVARRKFRSAQVSGWQPANLPEPALATLNVFQGVHPCAF